jgi:hypothetical protein
MRRTILVLHSAGIAEGFMTSGMTAGERAIDHEAHHAA